MAAKKGKKNKVGRPSEFNDAAALWAEAEKYFKYCEKNKLLPNKAGLAKFLNIHRDTLHDWESKQQFSDATKKIVTWIEDAWVQRLGGNKPTGAIFYLKNAFKDEYKDRHETDITSKGEQLGYVILPQRENSLATNGETK